MKYQLSPKIPDYISRVFYIMCLNNTTNIPPTINGTGGSKYPSVQTLYNTRQRVEF